jgi:hypothetical protein
MTHDGFLNDQHFRSLKIRIETLRCLLCWINGQIVRLEEELQRMAASTDNER